MRGSTNATNGNLPRNGEYYHLITFGSNFFDGYYRTFIPLENADKVTIEVLGMGVIGESWWTGSTLTSKTQFIIDPHGIYVNCNDPSVVGRNCNPLLRISGGGDLKGLLGRLFRRLGRCFYEGKHECGFCQNRLWSRIRNIGLVVAKRFCGISICDWSECYNRDVRSGYCYKSSQTREYRREHKLLPLNIERSVRLFGLHRFRWQRKGKFGCNNYRLWFSNISYRCLTSPNRGGVMIPKRWSYEGTDQCVRGIVEDRFNGTDGTFIKNIQGTVECSDEYSECLDSIDELEVRGHSVQGIGWYERSHPSFVSEWCVQGSADRHRGYKRNVLIHRIEEYKPLTIPSGVVG